MLGLIILLAIGLSVIPYAVFQALCSFYFKPQDLKRKYGASWGLVTGSSSGIGKSLAWKLASQKVNVVLVALPDDLLEKTFSELKSAHPDVEIRKVGVNLGDPSSGYMKTIDEATKDIDIQLLFCNAGYLVTGFFHKIELDKHLSNFECNSGSVVRITHHFLTKMVTKKLPGCVVLTSSPAGVMPGPFSVLYAATKAFVSSFGASLAAEVKSRGIDFLVFHPSPVATNFYDNQKRIDALEFFKRFACSADSIPDKVFGAIGRTVWQDLGPTAVAFRLLTKLMDFNTLASLVAVTAHTTGDFKRHNG